MEYEGSSQRRGIPGWGIALISCGGCIVITIPILAAILFPVFARARETARNSACMSNLKMCALALNMYAQDYGVFPQSPSPSDDAQFEAGGTLRTTSGAPMGWPASVMPVYLRADHPLMCPADGLGSDVSYTYKRAVNLASRNGINLHEFKFTAQQVLLYEAKGFHYGGGAIANGVSLNAAFVDGHVRKVTMQDVAPDTEPEYFNALDPAAPAMSKPYWDPRYCYDSLP